MKKSLSKAALRNALPALLIASAMCATPARADTPYIGEMIQVPYTFCPNGYLDANGQALAIAENDALFALLGTTYGGDGQTTFNVPDMRGRAVVHAGQGAGLSPRVLGQTLGSETVTLTTNQLPAHTHVGSVKALPTAGNTNTPVGNNFAASTNNDYSSATAPANNMKVDSVTVAPTGGSQPASVVQPYLAMKWCISLFGIYPPQQ